MGLLTLVGLGIASFLLILLFFKLGEIRQSGSNHFLLQLLVLGFILGTFILIGKATIDAENSEFCSWNVVNSTEVDINTSTYGYDYQCHTNTSSTGVTFYKMITWFVRVVATYIVLYFIYEILNYFGAFKIFSKK